MNNKRFFKILLCGLLVLALVISNFNVLDMGMVKVHADETAELKGEGTEENPFEISNYAQLKAFSDIVNEGYQDACAILVKDITCTDDMWVPIGNNNKPYKGHFNDTNEDEIKKIIGLSNNGIDNINNTNYQGLFGYIEKDGIVKNIGIESNEIKGRDCIGGVAGNNNGTISNCYNTGMISSSWYTTEQIYNYIGGVTGFNYGIITNCYNTGSISGSGEYTYAGGVTGNNSGEITECFNTGSIRGILHAVIGGIAGYNYNGTITKCYNMGSIIQNGDLAIVGGLVGAVLSGEITKCYNAGRIIGGGFQAVVGGVAGSNMSYGKITSCYNTGIISGGDNANVGGVVGNNDEIITNCYNTGLISGGDSAKVGGVTALNYGTITNCYNTSKIIGGDQAKVGGVAGSCFSGSIAYCYFDKSRSGVSDGVSDVLGNGHTEEIEDLTTEQMTGSNSKDNMIFLFSDTDVNPWIVRENDDNNYYYPHLNDVNFSADIISKNENNKQEIQIVDLEKLKVNDIATIKDWPARFFKVGENSGTINNPYEISDYNLLKAFSDIVNGTNQDACAILVNDISCTDDMWVPIGNNNKPYKGHFNDTNEDEIKKIIGLSNNGIDNINNTNYQGLFGYIEKDGIVKNIGIESNEIKGSDCIGGVAGKNNGTIINCYFTGTINGSHLGGNWGRIGGITGYNCDKGIIKKCFNTGMISGKKTDNNGPIDQSTVGGIAGENEGTITNCYNAGKINSEGTTSRTGGITGWNKTNGSIINSYNTGMIYVEIYSANVGGIAGENSGKTISCYNTGKISGVGDSNCGGIAGKNSCFISNCYNIGMIRCDGESVNVGAVVGIDKYNGTILGITTYCYYDKYISGVSKAIGDSDDTADVKGLSTIQMTGTDALEKYFVYKTDENEKSPWITKSDAAVEGSDSFYWFYPQLEGFNNTETNEWPAKVEAKVNWSVTDTNSTYDGNELKPYISSVELTFNQDETKVLNNDTDYKISYKKLVDNTWKDFEGLKDAGKFKTYFKIPAVSETDTDFYRDTNTVFTIDPKTLGTDSIRLSQTKYTYDGTAHKPNVTVLDGTKEVSSTEYSVSISDNVKAGTATVTVSDVAGGNYTVNGSVTFTVSKATPAYNVPTGLTSRTGKTLKDISLPSGWTWEDINLSVGSAGTNKFYANYTPDDTENYNKVEHVELSVVVTEAQQVVDTPVNNEPVYPYSTTKTQINDDGSVTTTLTIYYKDGSILEKSVREYKNGNKTTNITLKDKNNFTEFYASEALSFSKKGTKTVSTSISRSNGYHFYEVVKTAVSGKETVITQMRNTDKSSSYTKMITTPEGSIKRNSIKTDSKGISVITFGRYKTEANTYGKVSSLDDIDMLSRSDISIADAFSFVDNALPDNSAVITEMTYNVVSDDEAKLTKCRTKDREITVPSKININSKSYKVIAVSKYAFTGCDDLSKVTLGKTVTSIGKKAFAGLSNLKEIVFNSKNKNGINIGKDAFSGIADDAQFFMKADKDARIRTAKRIKRSGYGKEVIFQELKKSN